MKVTYGVGLMQLVPGDWFVVEEDRTPSAQARYRGPAPPGRAKSPEEKARELRRQYLERVSALNVSQVFCELVDGVVCEVANRGGRVESRWLSATEGAAVAQTLQRARGQLLHDQLPKGFDADFYVPGYTGRQGANITLPNYQAPCYVDGTTQGLNLLRRAWNDVPPMDREFVKELMDAFEAAHANRLWFWLWWG